jgi:hypothetical protein
MRELVRELSDGVRKSKEIAELIGKTPKYVQGIWKKNPDIPRPPQAPPVGEHNPWYQGGRSIDFDGYCLVSVPPGHPSGKFLRGKNYGRIYEHRLVMEKHLGRHLGPKEVVHHKNGCKIDNRIENLELCESNAEHLKMELTGRVPKWTPEGYANMCSSKEERRENRRVCSYTQMKRSGEIRKQQILLAYEILGKDHPSLFGMERYLGPKQSSRRKKKDKIRADAL